MFVNILRTKGFLTSLTCDSKPCIIRKIFPPEFIPTKVWSKISHGDKSTSYQTSNYFICIFSDKIFFLSSQLKTSMVIDLLKVLIPQGHASKYRYRKGFDMVCTCETGINPKARKQNSFPDKMNATVLILLRLEISNSEI